MTWQKNGTPDTLGSAGDTLDIADLTALIFNVFLAHQLATGGTVVSLMRLDGIGGTAYANRASNNGGADVTNVNDPQLQVIPGIADVNSGFAIIYIINISGEERLAIGFSIGANTAGAANVPARTEIAAKSSTTSGQFTQFTLTNVGTGDCDTDSNLSALGTD